MDRQLPVSLTRAQVKGSPAVDTRKPVSQQQETAYPAYYSYPFYWGGAGLWGVSAHSGRTTTRDRINESLKARRIREIGAPDDCHLRSCNAVIGHHLDATDGRVGRVEDMLVDDYTWVIRYLIVATSAWRRGEELLVPPHWIRKVSWPEKQVLVDKTRHSIRDAPHYNPDARRDHRERRRM